MPDKSLPFKRLLGAARMDEPDLANAVIVAVGVWPEKPHDPCLIFQFVDGADMKPVKAIYLRGDQKELTTIIADAQTTQREFSKDPEMLAAAVQEIVDDLKRDPTKPVEHFTVATMKRFCDRCGVRIFGDVAARGICLSCEKELPSGGVLLAEREASDATTTLAHDAEELATAGPRTDDRPAGGGEVVTEDLDDRPDSFEAP